MKLSARSTLGALLVLLPLVLSCTQGKQWKGSGTIPSAAPPDHSVHPPSEQVVARARNHMASGAYQEAIDILKAAYHEAPRDRLLASAYIDSLETMAATADRAFHQQHFSSAGKTYAVLQNNRRYLKGIDRALSFSFTGLSDKLEMCKKALLTGGFDAYRNGHLDQAIALWQDLLVIDPQNTAIQDALRTAKRQQKNLQEVE